MYYNKSQWLIIDAYYDQPRPILMGIRGSIMDPSDEDLVQLAQNGNLEAYNILLKRYHQKIQQILYPYLNERANVHDLTQDILLKVFRYLHYFKKNCQFSTWLNRIIHNTVKNHYRSLSLRLEVEARFIQEHNASHYSPERHIINHEFNKQVELAMTLLSGELRSCYGMHIFEGQSYEDIAKKMNCPIGTVRSRISRARKFMINYVKTSPSF